MLLLFEKWLDPISFSDKKSFIKNKISVQNGKFLKNTEKYL